MVEFEEFKLGNGIRAVLVPLVGLKSVTVEVFVKIGAKYEKPSEFGISHFLEHMAFKGTKKRTSAIEIHKELDSKGVSHNAGTGYEYTSYYIKTVKENVDWALEFLGDIIQNSLFAKEEIEKERRTIVEEIKMYKDNPTMGLYFEFMKQVWGENKVGCWDLSGGVEEVEKISKNDLQSYRERYLSGENMVIVIAGNLNRSWMLDLRCQIKDNFSGLKKSGVGLPKVGMEFGGKAEVKKIREMDQAHFCLGVAGVSWRDKRKYTARLLETILMGNSSSRLYEEIRWKRGWAYYIFSISESLENAGLIGMQAGVASDKLEEAVEISQKVMMGFSKEVGEADLKAAKNYIFGKTKLLMDKTEFWSDFVGQKVLLENRLVGVEEELAEYNKVNLEDVVKLSKEIFTEGVFRLLAISSNNR